MSRDVLAPPLLRMGANRQYRVNLVHEDFGGHPTSAQKGAGTTDKPNAYTEEDLYGEDDCEDDDASIEELANGKFKLGMHIAPSFYGGLIGFKGSTKRRIESETQTEIFVPRQREGNAGKSADIVTITGKTRANVLSAKRKISLMITSLRSRMRPTHFLSVELTNEEFKKNFEEFKKQILEADLPGIGEELFQTTNCMHLTLGVCVLLDDTERTKAVEILQSCSKYLSDLKVPFEVQVKGLEIMNDDPSAVKVLYACVEAPDLQKFADQAVQPFRQEGFSFKEFDRDSIKLHMTVLNSRYRKNQQAKGSYSFDAREILKRFGEHYFGRAECNEVKLCVMRAPKDPSDSYKVTGSLKFN